MAKSDDQYRQNFRADLDPALEKEINDALGDISIDKLIDDKAAARPSAAPAAKGMRHGRIVRVDLAKNEVMVDFGGKDQGVCPLMQFEVEPTEGQELDFVVVRRDPKEDILVLSLKGAKATHVSWDTLQVGQIVEG